MTSITRLRLNPLMRIAATEPLVCDLLLDKRSLELPDRSYLSFFAGLEHGATQEEAAGTAARVFDIQPDEARELVADLVENRVLVEANRPYPREASAAFWQKRGWLEGLLLHLITREVDDDDADLSPDDQAMDRAQVMRAMLDEGLPSLFKRYPDAAYRSLPPARSPAQSEPLAATMVRRRCNRPYPRKEIRLDELSALLGHGSRDVLALRLEAERTYQSQPERFLALSSWSAIETYVAAYQVEGLEPGLYHYDLRAHSIALVGPDIRRAHIVRACEGQKFSADGACNLLFTAVWERFMFRYRHPRAWRNLMVNMSELGHRYLLMATALGFSNYMTPQTLYRETQEIFQVPHYQEALLYVIGVG